MEKRARDGIAGGLRPNDPRRFLVEVLMGAAAAAGNPDPRAHPSLQKHLDENEIFRGLSSANKNMLLDLATDALQFAGGSLARVPAIAKGLPARVHRITALALACDLVADDGNIAPAATEYLEQLRGALRIAPHEAKEISAAAHARRTLLYLDDRRLRLRSLVHVGIDLFTLRALTLGKLDDVHRFEVRDFLLDIPDMALADHEIERLLYEQFKKSRAGLSFETELNQLAAKIPDTIDRYWMIVYAMCAEPVATLERWGFIPFLAVLQRTFGLTDSDMNQAAIDARGFPASLRRPA